MTRARENALRAEKAELEARREFERAKAEYEPLRKEERAAHKEWTEREDLELKTALESEGRVRLDPKKSGELYRVWRAADKRLEPAVGPYFRAGNRVIETTKAARMARFVANLRDGETK